MRFLAKLEGAFVGLVALNIGSSAIVAHFFGWGWTVLTNVVLAVSIAQLFLSSVKSAWQAGKRDVRAGRPPLRPLFDGVLLLLGRYSQKLWIRRA